MVSSKHNKLMSSMPTKRKPLSRLSRVSYFSEKYNHKDELLRLVTIMQLRINHMKENPTWNHNKALYRMGFNAREVEQLGI